jgi:hypothetical protein
MEHVDTEISLKAYLFMKRYGRLHSPLINKDVWKPAPFGSVSINELTETHWISFMQLFENLLIPTKVIF